VHPINGRSGDWERGIRPRLRLAGLGREWHVCCLKRSVSRAVADGEFGKQVGSCVMDVGITKSNKSHPVHFITGLLVVTISYSAVMFAVRAIVMS
jgi:hypothetical protein